jgi:hypothetical protein
MGREIGRYGIYFAPWACGRPGGLWLDGLRRLLLHGANGGLAELLEFVGLSDVVHLCPRCCPSVERCEPPTRRT